MDEYIKGLFAGVLLACFFMLVAAKQNECMVTVYQPGGKIAHSMIGVTYAVKD